MSGLKSQPVIKLPAPRFEGAVSLERALILRRSVRDYSRATLTLQEVSQLFWAGQGITDHDGLRTAPSAGALYPLELYLVVRNVEKLLRGLYRYKSGQHHLIEIEHGDWLKELASAALGQDCLSECSAAIVITAVYERTTGKYGQRGIRYVHMEVGSAAQNIYLQAASLGLGTVLVGAFDDSQVKRLLNLPSSVEPLGLMPIGKRA